MGGMMNPEMEEMEFDEYGNPIEKKTCSKCMIITLSSVGVLLLLTTILGYIYWDPIKEFFGYTKPEPVEPRKARTSFLPEDTSTLAVAGAGMVGLAAAGYFGSEYIKPVLGIPTKAEVDAWK